MPVTKDQAHMRKALVFQQIDGTWCAAFAAFADLHADTTIPDDDWIAEYCLTWSSAMHYACHAVGLRCSACL